MTHNQRTLIEPDSATTPTAAGAGLRLVVLVGDPFPAFELPASGDVVIGRGTEADVSIDRPGVSRRHAVLRLSPELSVSDLGSANGTKTGKSKLNPGEIRPLALGEPFWLGSTAAVILRANAELLRAGARTPPNLIVQSPQMKRLHELAKKAARGQISVLVTGETGAGKEHVAELIHRHSDRAKGPMLKLNCAALVEQLLESELFGHEKGSFTGAVAQKVGLIESANGGTVFLDEVGELSAPVQAKLLRVLEQREVLPVGGLKARPVDVRFVSATHRNLEERVKAGAFREDLFFRLAGVQLTVPPLRERPEDLEPLVTQFIQSASAAMNAAPPSVSPAAWERLRAARWPGNLRELRNVVERAVLFCDGGEILPEHLPSDAPAAASAPPASAPSKRHFSEPSDDEKKRILDTLEQVAGNQTRAAQLLGMSRRKLIMRLEEYGITRPRKK